MPDRLDALRHQRALVAEQLAWIDQEIVALSPRAPDPRPGVVAPLVSAAAPAAPQTPAAGLGASAATPPDFPDYQADPVRLQSSTRRGCLLYTALGLFLLLVAALAIYFLAYRDHPLLFIGDSGAPAAQAPRR